MTMTKCLIWNVIKSTSVELNLEYGMDGGEKGKRMKMGEGNLGLVLVI